MIPQALLDQLRHLIRPLSNRIASMVARGVVQLVADGGRLQVVQLGAAGEIVDDAEHHQPYGLSSVPLDGAEAVALFPNGDHGHPLVVVVSDRRHRPTGGEPGQVDLYGHTGARVTLRSNGDIEVRPAPGREVYVRNEGGTADRLVKVSEFTGHTHLPGTFAAPSGGGPVTGASAGAAAVSGTQTLRAE